MPRSEKKARARSARWNPSRLSQVQVARLMGLTATAVGKWQKRGCPRAADGTYDLAAVCRWIQGGACDVGRLPQAEMLRVVHVSKPTLLEWEKRGCPRNEDKSYDAAAVVGWRVAELEGRIAEARKMSDAERARTRRLSVDAEIRELELAERRREMLARPAVVAGQVARFETLKACLLGLIGRCRQYGVSEEQQEAIRREVMDMLRRLASGQVHLQLEPETAKRVEELLMSIVGEGDDRPPPAEGQA